MYPFFGLELLASTTNSRMLDGSIPRISSFSSVVLKSFCSSSDNSWVISIEAWLIPLLFTALTPLVDTKYRMLTRVLMVWNFLSSRTLSNILFSLSAIVSSALSRKTRSCLRSGLFSHPSGSPWLKTVERCLAIFSRLAFQSMSWPSIHTHLMELHSSIPRLHNLNRLLESEFRGIKKGFKNKET